MESARAACSRMRRRPQAARGPTRRHDAGMGMANVWGRLTSAIRRRKAVQRGGTHPAPDSWALGGRGAGRGARWAPSVCARSVGSLWSGGDRGGDVWGGYWSCSPPTPSASIPLYSYLILSLIFTGTCQSLCRAAPSSSCGCGLSGGGKFPGELPRLFATASRACQWQQHLSAPPIAWHG